MTLQASTAVDRRTAPRLSTNLAAEFASGTALIPVTVQHLSARGCGGAIAIRDPDLPDRIVARGVLRLPAIGQSTCGAVFPVTLRSVRSGGGRVVYGLEFGPLPAKQMHELLGMLEAIRSEG